MANLMNMPLYMRACIITSLVAFLFGYDTGSIGPVTTMKSFKSTLGDFSSTMHGVIVSSILLTGAIAASIAGILADRYGRTRLLGIGSFIYCVGAALEAAAENIAIFIFGRLLKGLGEGLFLSTVYVQCSEISPTRMRGRMTSLAQFLIVVGLVCGYFVCYGTSHIDSSASWRLPLALGSGLAFVFTLTASRVPHSPRWLLARGRRAEAQEVIGRLGLDEEEQEELLALANAGLEHDPQMDFLASLKQLFRDLRETMSPEFRARTLLGCFLMGMQQFSGIDGVLYYAPILFQQAGLSSEASQFAASGGSALAILLVTVPATCYADKMERKTSALIGGICITFLMVLMGSLYAAGEVHANSGAGKWVVIVSIYVFAIVFNGTWAISFRAFVVESMPGKIRSSASSMAQSSNWLANYAVALTTPVMIEQSSFLAYYVFAGCTMLCTVVIALFMFETKGHSLEDIERRYTERHSTAVRRWPATGFRLRRLRVNEA